jgi:cytochrome c oxidase assembly protein subunit 15
MARLAVNSLLGIAAMQVTLGIATLINYVPVPLAAAHQGGSLALLSMAIWLNHALKRLPK